MQGIPPIGAFFVFRAALAVGSTQLKVYGAFHKRARKDLRLPREATGVYEEMLKKLPPVVREAAIQRQDRVERAFEALEKGRLPHSTDRTEREYLLK